MTAIEVDASKNAIRIVVPAPDTAGTCANAYTRIGLAKLKIPKGVTVTCEVAGAPPAWRVRDCGGEPWSIDLLDSGEAQRRGAPRC